MVSWRAASLAVVILPMVTLGCASSDTPSPGAGARETSVEPSGGTGDADSLADRHWSLEVFGGPGAGDPPVEETEITLSFTRDGQANGTGGCNRYFGSFESGEDGALSFGPLGATRMACPTEIMDQETAFFRALEGASRYVIDGDRLTLFSGDGTGVLTFVELPASAGESE